MFLIAGVSEESNTVAGTAEIKEEKMFAPMLISKAVKIEQDFCELTYHYSYTLKVIYKALVFGWDLRGKLYWKYGKWRKSLIFGNQILGKINVFKVTIMLVFKKWKVFKDKLCTFTFNVFLKQQLLISLLFDLSGWIIP